MKRILSLLTILTLISSGVSTVISCGSQNNNNTPKVKYDVFNLNTWGKTQKNSILSNYLIYYNKRDKWFNWWTEGVKLNFADILSNVIENVNASEVLEFEQVNKDGLVPNQKGKTDKQIFKEGFNFNLKAKTNRGFSGECSIWIYGNVN